MLNVVIYENDKIFLEKNIYAVNHALMNTNIEYRIFKFDTCNKELEDLINNKNKTKIYILDVETEDISGIELATKIRENDYDSIVIFATSHDKYHNEVFFSRLSVLDFICKYEGYEKRLEEDIKAAIKIAFDQKTFAFTYNHILYRVQYKDILYIEKEPIIKRCIIHTTENDLYISTNINKLLELLGDNFVRTHQSCIVNYDNVKEIDFTNNIITFKNKESITLLTNKLKKELKDYDKHNK